MDKVYTYKSWMKIRNTSRKVMQIIVIGYIFHTMLNSYLLGKKRNKTQTIQIVATS